MFKSITIYQCTQTTSAVLKRLAAGLTEHQFQQCPEKSQRSIGFISPLQDSDEMTYETNGGVLFCLRTDEKSVPSKFVKQRVDSLVAKREAAGEDMSVVDIRIVKEDVVDALLPGIPPEPHYTRAYIDKSLGMLFVEASEKDADRFMESLKKALGGTPFILLGITDEPCDKFTGWLKDPETLGDDLTLGDSCSLKQAKDGGTAIVNIKKDELESPEIDAMLEAGKQCCRIGLVHEDAEFAVTARLGIRQLIISGDQQDDDEEDHKSIPSQFAVVVSVVRVILAALEPLLGGWPKQELLDLGDEQAA